MKYLLVLVVVVFVLWLMLRGRDAGGSAGTRRAGGGRAPATMIACAHCGVHLPPADAVSDAGGRAYCSDAHRLAGPR
jgi:uncharacterized protein